MSHDVFISHSSHDKPAADAVCHGLEAEGIRCWIAPRDQVAGKPYGQQITEAIASAHVMVLVFSEHVNSSEAVLNEINLAASAHVAIVPFRIAAVEFNPELSYYLGRAHWLDAFPGRLADHVGPLADAVRRNLGGPAATASSPPRAVAKAARRPSTRTLVIGGVAVGAVLALAAGGTAIALLVRQPPPSAAKLLSTPGADTTPIRPANPQQVADYENVVVPSGPPATLAGASVINTAQLVDKIKAHDAGQIHFWLIDARGCSTEPTLPTADCMQPNTIQQIESEIPSKTMELIFFCLDGSCPESYEAAKSALAAGYTDVLWYRGGVNAWSAAGLPTVTHAS